MMYESLIHDFAKRTLANLDSLKVLRDQNPEVQFYEVTNLINSMLGLLIFPQQAFVNEIPPTPLLELADQGWPIPRVIGSFEQVQNLNQLIRYLRNAIAHCNVKFKAGDRDEIIGIVVWNNDTRASPRKTWQAELSIEEIEQITRKFVALILAKPPPAMSTRISQQVLESYLWGAAVLLRGLIDAGDYK